MSNPRRTRRLGWLLSIIAAAIILAVGGVRTGASAVMYCQNEACPYMGNGHCDYGDQTWCEWGHENGTILCDTRLCDPERPIRP
jgi:hypothetical protein